MQNMNTPPTPPKPIRVTVPVSPHVLETFQTLAKASGMSTGKAMAEWLLDTVDAAEFLAKKVKEARSAPKQLARELHSYALGLTDVTSDLLSKIQEGASVGTALAGTADGTIQEFAESVKRKPKRGLTPPSSNTGGKGRETPKKPVGGKK